MLEGMSPVALLTEAQKIRDEGLEVSWVSRESLIYPKVYRCLDGQIDEKEMFDNILADWCRLINEQDHRFAALRSSIGVLSIRADSTSVEEITRIAQVDAG